MPAEKKNMRFNSKVVLVTGAASGIGFATATHFAHEGATVVLIDLNADRLAAAEKKLRSEGYEQILTIECDVSKEDQVTKAVDKAIAVFGKINVIVNNAGLMTFKKLVDQVGDDWIRILSVD